MEKYFMEPGHLAWSLRGKSWKPWSFTQSHDYITPTQILARRLHTEIQCYLMSDICDVYLDPDIS